MKHFTVLSLILFASLFVSPTESINATFGAIGPFNTLLHREYVVLPAKWLRIVTRIVQFPAQGYINTRVISAVRAADYSRNQNGGYTTLYRGGPGYKNVTLQLQSLRSQSLNLTVEIYGR